MSRIDELIQGLCPNGVEHKTLGDVGEFVRGNGLQKKDLLDEGVPAVHYGQIHTHYGVWATETKWFAAPAVAAKLRHAKPGDLLIATTSEDDDAVAKATAWLGVSDAVLSGDAYIYRHSLEPKYVAYYFQTEQFHRQKRRFISGTKVRRISGASLAKIVMPVPPLEVQREIVHVLDVYSVRERELAVQLEAEREARRAQYDLLMQDMIAAIDAPTEPLRQLGEWRGGMTPSKSKRHFWETGSVPWLASMDVSESEGREIRGRVTPMALAETSLRVIPSPSVVAVMRSNILRRRLPIGFVDVDTTVNQDIKALIPRDGVDADYVYQVLRSISEAIRRAIVRTDGSMAAVDSKAFLEWRIPVPSLPDQRRIAARLREIDGASNDLRRTLGDEASARRKQYEHYRDRLLTFKEAVT